MGPICLAEPLMRAWDALWAWHLSHAPDMLSMAVSMRGMPRTRRASPNPASPARARFRCPGAVLLPGTGLFCPGRAALPEAGQASWIPSFCARSCPALPGTALQCQMPAPVASDVSNQKARVLFRKRKRPGKDAAAEQV